jgi:hypothetical protein
MGRWLPFSPSCQIEAEVGDAVQACLDKQPLPADALGDVVAKARRSRGSGGGATDTPIATKWRQKKSFS